MSAPHAGADLLRRRAAGGSRDDGARRLGEPVRRGYLERPARPAADDALLESHEAVLGIPPPADSPRVSRLESDSGVVRAGLEAGRESALALLRPLVA